MAFHTLHVQMARTALPSVLVPAGLHCRAILLQWGPLGWGKQSSGEHHAGGRELLASWNLVKLPEGQTKSKAYSHRIQARVPGPRPYARCCQAPQETNTAQAATGPRNTGDSALGLWRIESVLWGDAAERNQSSEPASLQLLTSSHREVLLKLPSAS